MSLELLPLSEVAICELPEPDCTPCMNPLEYIFQEAFKEVNPEKPTRGLSLMERIDRVLDKGNIEPICNVCCPSWNLSNSSCCVNVEASVETYLKYAEAVGLTAPPAVPALPEPSSDIIGDLENGPCCNNFKQCVDSLTCWAFKRQGPNGGRTNTSSQAEIVDRILDKGIVEYGYFEDCEGNTISSQVCTLLQILETYFVTYPGSLGRSSGAEIIDRLIDKGIVVTCDENGNLAIASVETWLKYGEAMGYTASAAVPALPEGSTTTTTTVVESTTTTTLGN
jgi:hypothetical protein